MDIVQTEDIRPFGAKGYIVVNDENLAILKEIKTDEIYILMDNIQRIYYLDKSNKIFELIAD